MSYGPLGLTEVDTIKENRSEIFGKCFNTTIRIIDFDKVTLDYILISKDFSRIELSQKKSKKLSIKQKLLSDLISIGCIKNDRMQFLVLKHRCLGNNITCETDNHLVINNETLKIIKPLSDLDECDEKCVKDIIEIKK